MEDITSKCPMAKINNVSDDIITFIRKKLFLRYGDKKPLRGFHAKNIGRVKAILHVEPNLDERLQQGLFKSIMTYKAWIRFTNGNGDDTEDSGKKVRGMAIKIMDAQSDTYLDEDKEGKTQDIILFTSPISVPGQLTKQKLIPPTVLGNVLEKGIAAIRILFSSPAAALKFKKTSLIETPNILEEMYWSATPYRFGGKEAIKWHTRPLKTITSTMPANPGRDYLTDQLIADLTEPMKEEISFALFVQFQENENTEPIEDPSVEWKTKFYKVATINIPAQIPITRKDEDNMSFSPGHAIAEHAPLGGVNMIRRKVYETLAKERNAHP